MIKRKAIDIGVSEEAAGLASRITVVAFFICHLIYLLLFGIFKVYFMFYLNIASVIYYTISLFFVTKRRSLYIRISFVELLIHAACGIVCLGWGYGFQYIFIGLVVLVFYASYMAKKLHRVGVPPFILTFHCIALFVGLIIWTFFKEPFYEMPDVFPLIFSISHGLIVFVFIIVFMHLLTEYALALEAKIYNQSITDPLTGLNNRLGFKDSFDKIEKDEYVNYVMAIADIDGFKSLNDTYGHGSGDVVLQTIAKTLSDSLKDDIVCRWGGEEFVAILKITDEANVVTKLNEIRELISKIEFTLRRKSVHVTITIGAADYRAYDSLEEWVSAADKKLYYGKENGKNIVIY